MKTLKRFNLLLFLLASALSFTVAGVAQERTLTCPKFFSSNMVLQQGRIVPIWGWANPGTVVTVEFAGQKQTATTGADGRWTIRLDALKASSEGMELTISAGAEKLSFSDVLVGEVWLASGQSNMQWGLASSSMPKEELAELNKPLIRIITVNRKISATPQQDLTGTWQVLDAKSGPGSSAVACYFAMKLQEALNVPIGILSTSWGGTRIEPWTPAEGFDLVPELKGLGDGVRALDPGPEKRKEADLEHIAAVKLWVTAAEAEVEAGKTPAPLPRPSGPNINNRTPGAIYNAMIRPLVGVAMRGAIWYQGESNMGEGLLYEKKMQALVGGWRELWGQGEFPFYFVQLAPFGNYSGERLGGIWEAQMFATRSIKNCGMAVTTDIGNLRDIHPNNKLDVGNRLALWALARDYGKDLVYSGPLYTGHEIDDGKVIISFEHADRGLAFKGEEITDVYIKGDGDEDFVKATPTIDGSRLVVTHPQGKKPISVRMGWNPNAQPNLMNKEGLPASPFRTDQ